MWPHQGEMLFSQSLRGESAACRRVHHPFALMPAEIETVPLELKWTAAAREFTALMKPKLQPCR